VQDVKVSGAEPLAAPGSSPSANSDRAGHCCHGWWEAEEGEGLGLGLGQLGPAERKGERRSRLGRQCCWARPRRLRKGISVSIF
jgi:hypothetical protein